MNLFCEKHKKELSQEEAFCANLEEYCKFREACIINFETKDRQREERQERSSECKCDPGGCEK